MKQLMHACVAEHEKEIRMDEEATEENLVTVKNSKFWSAEWMIWNYLSFINFGVSPSKMV